MAMDRITDPLSRLSSTTVEHQETRMAPTRWLAAVPTTLADQDDPRGWYQRAVAVDAANTGRQVVQLAVSNLSPREREETRSLSPHLLADMDADQFVWDPPLWSVMVKAGERVVTHAGILYRVIQVGDLRVPVGGITGVMTLADWRGRGYARAALASAAAFVATRLWAPFVLAICPPEDSAFYATLGWRVTHAPIWCEQRSGRVRLTDAVAVSLPCQGEVAWPSGSIDLCGAPW